MNEEITRRNKKFWEHRAQNNPFFSAGSPVRHDDPSGEIFGRYRNRSEFNHLKNKIKLKGKTVLDFGCGTGRLSFKFAKYCKHVTGVDFAPTMIKQANEYALNNDIKNVSFYVSELQNFKSEQKFDIIYLGGVLMCIDDVDVKAIVKNMTDLIVNDGVVINRDTVSLVSERKTPKIFNRKDRTDYAVYRTVNEVKNIFQPQFTSSYISETYPFVLSQNLYNRLSKQLKQNKIILQVYDIGLYLQSILFDTFLLNNKNVYKKISANWKKSNKPVRQFYFFFKYSKHD